MEQIAKNSQIDPSQDFQWSSVVSVVVQEASTETHQDHQVMKKDNQFFQKKKVTKLMHTQFIEPQS